MKQLLILSGKGGTGKTTIASAFINLSNAEIYADCDVDAPNLHLISALNSKPIIAPYYAMPKAQINNSLCSQCGLCMKHCKFDAISINTSMKNATCNIEDYCNIDSSNKIGISYKIDDFACEGCGVCEAFCPVDAISLTPSVAGELMLYQKEDKVFSTAKLKMGSGTSGKLVTAVKSQMISSGGNKKLAIIDGSPGIGCPVIASLSGVDMVLIVTEPSLSGISDMKRIVKTAEQFGTEIVICTNKFDINPANTEKIQLFSQNQGLPFVGKIPFDSEAVKAINNGKSIVDINCPSGVAVIKVFQKTMELLFRQEPIVI